MDGVFEGKDCLYTEACGCRKKWTMIRWWERWSSTFVDIWNVLQRWFRYCTTGTPFLTRDAYASYMHSAVLAVDRSVCHTLNCFSARYFLGESYNESTLVKAILVSPKIRVLLSETLSQTLNLADFLAFSSQRVVNLVWPLQTDDTDRPPATVYNTSCRAVHLHSEPFVHRQRGPVG